MEIDNYAKLTAVGLSTFSENHRKIMSSLVESGIPANYAVLTESACEAIILAVASMILENNKFLSELPD